MADFYGDHLNNIINGTAAQDWIYGNDGNDTLNGNGGNDGISGGKGNDLLNSGAGDNFLDGGAGNDTLNGESGNDVLNGEGGSDILTGGLGSNVFLFRTPLVEAGVHSITDFSISVNNKIVLDYRVFGALESFVLNNSPLMATDFSVIDRPGGIWEQFIAGMMENEIIYNRRTGSLFYNSNGSQLGLGAGGAQFARIVGSPDNISHTNFYVIYNPPPRPDAS